MSIQQYLDKIKNAIYGREVRGAIHDAIKQTYDDAAEGGDANMEVKMARGSFPNLNARLEGQDNKFSQIDAELHSIKATKAEKTYVETLVSNITDGSPKEFFNSIASLETKYPNGSIGPMLVSDESLGDGAHVFIWVEGEGWRDAGLYQSMGIKDESVSLRHLSTALIQNIALDEIYANWELGGLNANTGETLDSTTRGRIEDYVLINQGTIRSLNPNEVKFRVFEYGFGKDFISVSPWLTDNDYVINEPRFIKVMMAYQDDRVINDINLLASYLEIKDEKIADGSIGINKLSPQLQSIFINEGEVW